METELRKQKIEEKESMIKKEINLLNIYPRRATSVDYSYLREFFEELEEDGRSTIEYRKQLKNLGVEL